MIQFALVVPMRAPYTWLMLSSLFSNLVSHKCEPNRWGFFNISKRTFNHHIGIQSPEWPTWREVPPFLQLRGDAVGRDTHRFWLKEKSGELWTRLLPITKMTNSIAGETWLQFHWWPQPRSVAFISAILDIDPVLLPTELDLRLESNRWNNSYNFNHRPK